MRPSGARFLSLTAVAGGSRRPHAKAARLVAMIITVAATVTACALSSASTTTAGSLAGPSGTPVLVGFSVSLTGDFAADGQAVLRGYQLWRDDVNAGGGLFNHHPVKLIYFDDKSDPKAASAIYQKLLTHYHVQLLLGPFSSLLTAPAGKVAAQHGMAFVEGSGEAPSVFSAHLHNLFGVSAPVADQLDLFANWAASQPPGIRPKTAAYAMIDDPFADPPVIKAEQILAKAGVATVYTNDGQTPGGLKPYSDTSTPAQLAADADAVAAKHPDAVVIGSVDVPTVAAFINEFRKLHFNPKMLIAASGPDQGQAFLSKIGGVGNANGIMVPDGWYGGLPIALSHVLVQEYIAKYGGTASDINADVAEAYSAGEVMADAVDNAHALNAAGKANQASIIKYLHQGITLQTVQGPALFDSDGRNTVASTFIFQWRNGARFVRVLPPGTGSVKIRPVKPAWTS